MSRVVYVNGRYSGHAQACVHVEDRGYQFADGVYEVCEVLRGEPVDMTRHLDRLERSLAALRIASPLSRPALRVVIGEIIARNRVIDGMVYVQVTRGVARRDHAYPKATRPSLVVSARAIDRAAGEARARSGVSVKTTPDIRWRRVDIKTIGLLPNAMARQEAREAGAFEAWFVDDQGLVTEGAATNAWIVMQDRVVVTRHLDNAVLAGVTRATLMDLLAREGLRIEERAFSVAEALGAAEAFMTGATLLVMPVIAIDERPIGSGAPGPVASRLRAMFHAMAQVGMERG